MSKYLSMLITIYLLCSYWIIFWGSPFKYNSKGTLPQNLCCTN